MLHSHKTLEKALREHGESEYRGLEENKYKLKNSRR
jgi:hypothetical protein